MSGKYVFAYFIRFVLNESEVIKTLEKFSKENDLNFVIFKHTDYVGKLAHEEDVGHAVWFGLDTKWSANDFMLDRLNVFYNSDIIVAPHGGANYHIYACKEETQYIELVGEASIGLFASALVDYHVKLVEQPFDGDGPTKSYSIDTNKLLKILNKEDIIDTYHE